MLCRLAFALCLSTALLGAAGSACAQGRPMDETQLSDVWGQALLQLTNTSLNGYDFSRITLGADVQFNANFTNVRLGEYSYSARNGTGADIDLGALRFGRSDGTEAQRVVNITDPYLEFVYKNVGDASKREVVGMRLGFGSIQGDVGIQMNSVSGSLLINAAGGAIDSRLDPLGGKRWDGTTCGASACSLALSQIGGITAGDANGASRDFFISLLREAVQYPTVNGAGASDKALEGFWLNWRDRLTANRINQPPPPNLPKPPGG
ncbi:hypothetical protein [Ideonella sp. BN130291]|uniref:hypothetical protein n=1 Tax=Ideonella sp. BN130291 TaxID=3112940 RepID=UPI002E274365|nr:hypothetical protein [Ideonella sp. BN130291]